MKDTKLKVSVTHSDKEKSAISCSYFICNEIHFEEYNRFPPNNETHHIHLHLNNIESTGGSIEKEADVKKDEVKVIIESVAGEATVYCSYFCKEVHIDDYYGIPSKLHNAKVSLNNVELACCSLDCNGGNEE
jgi:hypothetical protein